MPAIEPRKENAVPIISPLTVLADAGAILQKALQQLTPDERSSIILRCDELPQVKESEEKIEKAFLQLLNIIVDKKPGRSKLYLHINCSAEKTEDLDLSLPPGFSRFFIQFHTNLLPDPEWMKIHQPIINDIDTSLKSFGGSLSVNLLKNPGCLFAISIPGKQ